MLARRDHDLGCSLRCTLLDCRRAYKANRAVVASERRRVAAHVRDQASEGRLVRPLASRPKPVSNLAAIIARCSEGTDRMALRSRCAAPRIRLPKQKQGRETPSRDRGSRRRRKSNTWTPSREDDLIRDRKESGSHPPERASLLGVGQGPPGAQRRAPASSKPPNLSFSAAGAGRRSRNAAEFKVAARWAKAATHPPNGSSLAAREPEAPAPGALLSSPRRCYRSWAGALQTASSFRVGCLRPHASPLLAAATLAEPHGLPTVLSSPQHHRPPPTG
ncbi:hypothetical protein HPB50_003372 [Hyalomma asiaticum]|uniref:Uncharacterized protein n=1 Tax=Hyalomma asiaticum TaxID=266040 RepID=A0ACB7TBP7_HYAAI|nr:hypothetical protein HPB50_003372 [Hyalomma asiaticum]